MEEKNENTFDLITVGMTTGGKHVLMFLKAGSVPIQIAISQDEAINLAAQISISTDIEEVMLRTNQLI